MLIKNISIKNFRQFKGEHIVEFAKDPNNNITIIMGENGSGKTTLAQAFLWVLYGKTEFKDKKIISKKAIDDIELGDSVTARVDLVIEEDNIEITISRFQEFLKKQNRVEANQAELQVSYKTNGQVKYKSKDECQLVIENILPYELSSFFIFSGERIKNMSEEIQNGKSNEFANAVRSLVGLNAIMNTLRHLKGKTLTNNTTVLGRYNKKIDESSNSKIKAINSKIELYENNINTCKEQIEKLKPNLKFYQTETIRLDEEILSYAPAEKVKREYDLLSKRINEYEVDYVKAIKNFFKLFNNNGLDFFLKPAIEASLSEIDTIDNVDKGIPHIHADTIKYLLNKGKCICGHSIESGSEEAIELTKLLDYLPPKSIGGLINQHKKNSNNYLNNSRTFFDSEENYFTRIREIDLKIKEGIETQTNMKNNIIDASNLNNLKLQKSEYEKKAQQAQQELEDKIKAIGSNQELLKRELSQKDTLINIDSKNKKYIQYKKYAEKLYDILSNDYTEAETTIRKELEEKINRIFINGCVRH